MASLFGRVLVRLGRSAGAYRWMHSSEAARVEMAFTFASPAEVFYDQQHVKQVDVPSYNGYWGILPQHVPVLGVLKPGVLAVHEDSGNVKKFFVSSGSVTVNADSSLQVLAEEAAPIDRLDAHAIAEGLQKAHHDLASATTDEDRAKAQIALECYEALKKAVDAGA